MGATNKMATWALAVFATACGGGGSTGSAGPGGGSSEAVLGAVQLLGHVPADGAVQVALDAAIVLTFDAAMALDSFGDEDTWLRVAGSTTDVAGTFALGANGRVTFRTTSPLQAETDYELRLSALTCDQTGRILDIERTFTFRTFDDTPPTIATIDVVDNAQSVGRTRSFTATFSEAIRADSVTAANCFVRDVFNTRFAARIVVQGAAVMVTPMADLPGDRQCQLVLGSSIADRAGNRLGTTTQRTFRTALDLGEPRVIDAWPPLLATAISPLVQPEFAFDESMDPATVEAVSLLFQDEFGSIVPFAIDSSADQRRLRVRPLVALQQNRRYTLAFLLGPAAATDVSGNSLSQTQARTFTTGSDSTPPAVAGSSPTDGESRVPGQASIEVTFTEPLDSGFLDTDIVTLTVGGAPWTVVVDQPAPNRIRVQPVLTLPTDRSCVLTLRGGHEGLHDLAGNTMPADRTLTFVTSSDAEAPNALLLPADGAAGVATDVHTTVVFDAPMDPSTLTAASVRLTDDAGLPIATEFALSGGNRIVTLTPQQPLPALTYHQLHIRGGPTGVRRTTGNWFVQDRTARFRTGTSTDSSPPTVGVRVNGIPTARQQGLVLPPSGFTIDVAVSDTGNQWVDMGSIAVQLQGTGSGPAAATLLAAATIDYGSFRVVIPTTTPLTPGEWSLSVQASDLAGNVGNSPAIGFVVVNPTSAMLPFERTQLVWVRHDLDRDGNGTADFDDDLRRLGLATAGDAAGTNGFVRSRLLDAILAQANRLFGRGDRGEPLDAGSVALRFTKRQPISLPHMQMALGGLDPEGDRNRGYGDDSTGVLGRAYYDYRNSNPSERNTTTAPGLGVFPAEMWLYQTLIHIQVWPSFQTVFAQRFRPLCPDMGGTPAGSHPLDAQVLRSGFDYAAANSSQRARWQTVMNAVDDWSSVIGVILAHEVGHSVGLVAPGPSPTGLFGDSSLHNSYAGAAEVMAPSVGYEAMISLDYQFRDIDLAYLRQRVLLR